MAGVTKHIAELQQLDSLPAELLTIAPTELHALFKQPTLVHLTGKRDNTLFVSVMLHGNETTGFYAIQQLLRQYQSQTLPRNVSIFFGNSEAAQYGLRRLDGQPDFNRIWPGSEYASCAETIMAEQIVDSMATRNLFAAIDVHNNTGLNPHYACINRLDNHFQQLARLFGRLVVFFTRPKGVMSAAFAPYCPAVTLECGRPDQPNGAEHALEFIQSCLHLDHLPEHPLPPQDIDLFHTVAQVKVNPAISFSFDDLESQLLLDKDIEKMNFFEIPAGTPLAKLNELIEQPLLVKDEAGLEAIHHFFEIENEELRFKRPTMPSMMTLDEQVIRQDCLCYLMERLQG